MCVMLIRRNINFSDPLDLTIWRRVEDEKGRRKGFSSLFVLRGCKMKFRIFISWKMKTSLNSIAGTIKRNFFFLLRFRRHYCEVFIFFFSRSLKFFFLTLINFRFKLLLTIKSQFSNIRWKSQLKFADINCDWLWL